MSSEGNPKRTLSVLLGKTHPKDVDFGFLMSHPTRSTPREKDELKIWTRVDLKTREFTKVSPSVDYKVEQGEIATVEEIYRLALDFGGDRYIRLMLQNTNPDDISRTFFDLMFFDGERSFSQWHPAWPESPKNLYKHKTLVTTLFESLGVDYEIKDEGIHVPKPQHELEISPKKVAWAYGVLCDTGYLPSISNGSRRKGFAVFNSPFVNESEVSTSLHLNVNDELSRVDRHDLELLEQTLRRHGVVLGGQEYSFAAENICGAKYKREKGLVRV